MKHVFTNGMNRCQVRIVCVEKNAGFVRVCKDACGWAFEYPKEYSHFLSLLVRWLYSFLLFPFLVPA